MPTSQIFEVSRFFDGLPTAGQTLLPKGGATPPPNFGQTQEPVNLTTAGPNVVVGDSVNFLGTDYDITGLFTLDTESIFGGSGSNINSSYTSYIFELTNPADPSDTQTIWIPIDSAFLFQEIETISVNTITPITSIPVINFDRNDSYFTVCFASGTQIATRTGNVAIETLAKGDEIITMDHGCQAIRWIGSRNLDAADLAISPNLMPIRIAAGALGNGLPEQDLMVSPQHRMLVRSVVAERMFNTSEVLIPANKLLPLSGVEIADDATEVTYWHILFDEHEIIYANGAPSESLFTGPEALKAVRPAARAEITALFPEVIQQDYVRHPVRPIPAKGKQAKTLVERLHKNAKDVVEWVN